MSFVNDWFHDQLPCHFLFICFVCLFVLFVCFGVVVEGRGNRVPPTAVVVMQANNTPLLCPSTFSFPPFLNVVTHQDCITIIV